MNKRTSILITTLTLLSLTGCTSGPSNSEIENAVIAHFQKSSQMMNGFIGTNLKLEEQVKKVINHGCNAVADRNDVFKCDLEIQGINFLTGQKETSREIATLSKIESGWKIN